MEEQADRSSAIDSLESTLKSSFDHLRQQQQSRLEQISTLMSSLESFSQATTTESEALQNIVDSSLGEIDTFKSEVGNNGDQIQHLESQIESLRAELENSEREKGALADKVQAVESDQSTLNALQEELNARNEALETLQREFDELRRAHDQEHGELESLRQRCGELEEKLTQSEAAAAANSGDTQQLHDQIAALEGEVSARDELLKEAQEATAQLQSSLESGEATAQEQEQRIARKQEEFEQLQAELENQKHALEHADSVQEGLKTELLSVQREAEGIREKYREGLSTEAALALRQQVTETTEAVQRLEQELETARSQSKKSVLAQQLAEAIQEAETATEENQALRQELSLLREGVDWQAPDAAAAPADDNRAPEPTRQTVDVVERSPEEDLIRIQKAATSGRHKPKPIIGQILLEAEVISNDQLQQALELQKSNPQQHLGALLTELGFATQEAVAQARASQCGVDFIRFADDTVDPNAASLINERLANQHSCIPISVSGPNMILAVTNPMDLLAIEDVERYTNKKVDVVVGTVPEIESAITRYYWEPE